MEEIDDDMAAVEFGKDSATIMASLVVATRKGVAREVLCGMLRVFLQRDVSSENSLKYTGGIPRAYFQI